MSKHTQAVIAALVMTLFALGSFPTNKTASTSVIVPPPQLLSPSNNDKPSDKEPTASTSSQKRLDAETRTQFMKLVEEHRLAMSAWQAKRDTIPGLERKKKDLETKVEQELSQRPENPTFDEREWTSEDGKYKVTATLLDSDFKLAKLKKPDGSIVEVTKEKLSAPDKQAIERAFAVIEVSVRREKEWMERLAALDKEKNEVQSLIDQAKQPAPETPTVELAKQLVKELRNRKVAEKRQQDVDKPAQRQPSVADYKYVQDDFYPDIYAFRSIAQLKHYWQLPKQNPNLTQDERAQLGIELIESKTCVRILSRVPFDSAAIFEVEPTTGRQKGKRLFVTSLDVYDQLR
jgi:hypothetical protein